MSATVVLQLADSGEVLEWEMSGEDEGEPWEKSALELALGLVPSLEQAIDRARRRRESVTVKVTAE